MEQVIATGLLTGRVLRVLAVALLMLYILLFMVLATEGDLSVWAFLPFAAVVSPFLSTPRFLEARNDLPVSAPRAFWAIVLGLPLQVYTMAVVLPDVVESQVPGMIAIVGGLLLLAFVHTVCVAAMLVLIALRPGLDDVFK